MDCGAGVVAFRGSVTPGYVNVWGELTGIGDVSFPVDIDVEGKSAAGYGP